MKRVYDATVWFFQNRRGTAWVIATTLNLLLLGWAFSQLQDFKVLTEQYVQTTGVVLSARIDTNKSTHEDFSDTFLPVVEYTFAVGDREYKSTRLSPREAMPRPGHWAKSVFNRCTPGCTAPVYYNPQHPSDSFLNKEAPHEIALLLLGGSLGLVFCLAFAAVAVFFPRKSTPTFITGCCAFAAVFLGLYFPVQYGSTECLAILAVYGYLAAMFGSNAI